MLPADTANNSSTTVLGILLSSAFLFYFFFIFSILLLPGVPEAGLVERGQGSAEESFLQKSITGANTHWNCARTQGATEKSKDQHSVSLC